MIVLWIRTGQQGEGEEAHCVGEGAHGKDVMVGEEDAPLWRSQALP